MKDNPIVSSEDMEGSRKLESMMKKNSESILSKQSNGKLGASKGLGFGKSVTDRKKSFKFNMDSLKNLKKLNQVSSTKNSQKGLKQLNHEDYFARKGRLTSSNIPWTTRSPYHSRELGAEGAEGQLKYSDLMSKDKTDALDPVQMFKEKSLREKYRLEQIEQWKRENGYKKNKHASGKIPSQYMKKLEASGKGFGNSYSGKEGLSQLYQKNKPKVKMNTPGSFSGTQLNLKNFSSNTQMYNYGTAGHSNLNFSKNKFNMKPRFTNFASNSKADKFYNQSRNYLRSTDHLMPEITKKSSTHQKRNCSRSCEGKSSKTTKSRTLKGRNWTCSTAKARTPSRRTST